MKQAAYKSQAELYNQVLKMYPEPKYILHRLRRFYYFATCPDGTYSVPGAKIRRPETHVLRIDPLESGWLLLHLPNYMYRPPFGLITSLEKFISEKGYEGICFKRFKIEWFCNDVYGFEFKEIPGGFDAVQMEISPKSLSQLKQESDQYMQQIIADLERSIESIEANPSPPTQETVS